MRRDTADWLSIDSAPRDGSWIELKNNFGLMPTYTLSRWESGDWSIFGQENMGVSDGPHLQWRPYRGEPSAYVDPTNGAQDRHEYWDGAIARSSGMSVSRLHAIRAENQAEQERFGNGDDAPHWPERRWNAQYTLKRGVWCDDAFPTPSRFRLWLIRRKHHAIRKPADGRAEGA